MPDTAKGGCIRQPREYEGGLGPEFEAMLGRIREREAAEARRGIRAWVLAPTLDLYHALMRGEDIPDDQLNPEAVRRYGIRRKPAA